MKCLRYYLDEETNLEKIISVCYQMEFLI